jgi:hypothetical protein
MKLKTKVLEVKRLVRASYCDIGADRGLTRGVGTEAVGWRKVFHSRPCSYVDEGLKVAEGYRGMEQHGWEQHDELYHVWEAFR